jgi:hypothetical protein
MKMKLLARIFHNNASIDAFLTKLDTTGAALIYSTFLGGSKIDEASAVALDASGNAYVVGVMRSLDFPTTPGAVQNAPPYADWW